MKVPFIALIYVAMVNLSASPKPPHWKDNAYYVQDARLIVFDKKIANYSREWSLFVKVRPTIMKTLKEFSP